jgi:hypothetical protein
MAGPGLLSYIVTSKFSDYLPLYRLEDIFARQGFEISRATQSVWCGDVVDLVEPLYALMAERVRSSHVVATDDTIDGLIETELRDHLLCDTICHFVRNDVRRDELFGLVWTIRI